MTVNCIIWLFSWWGMPPMVMNASSSRFEPISTLALLWYCFRAMSAAGEAVRETPSIVGPEQQPPGSPGTLPGCSQQRFTRPAGSATKKVTSPSRALTLLGGILLSAPSSSDTFLDSRQSSAGQPLVLRSATKPSSASSFVRAPSSLRPDSMMALL